MHRVQQLDQRWFIRLQGQYASLGIQRLSFWVSKTADGPWYGLIACLWYLCAPSSEQLLLERWLVAFAFELPCYLLLKNIIRRHRPMEVLAGHFTAYISPSDRFSLPSGHTAGAFTFGLVLCCSYPWLLGLVLPWAVAVGAARVMLGVHYPCDVVAGMSLGVAATVVSCQLLP